MKIYPTLGVNATFQFNGSNLLIILVGLEEEIELTVNGLFNHGAVGKRSRLEYTNHLRNRAFIWSTPQDLFSFFFNFYTHRFFEYKTEEMMARYMAWIKFKEAQANSNPYFNFERADMELDELTTGRTTAERPDNDFRDAVLKHSLNDRTSVKEVEKQLAS